MKRVTGIVLAALTLVAWASPAATASTGSARGREPSVVPAHRVAGTTGGELIGEWWAESLSRPASASPQAGTLDLCLNLGRGGRVQSPAGGITVDSRIEMSCTVEAGLPVVMVMISGECSTVEDAPFTLTRANRRTCAPDLVRPGVVTPGIDVDVKAVTLAVDGAKPVDIFRPRYLEVSPPRHVQLPENSLLGASGPATFSAAGYMAEIRGLRPGDHTVTGVNTYSVDGADPRVEPFIVHFHVIR